ncbi:MAG TPA: metalloregulator ArsR/SmtB family transcription factor [Acidisphaera sp.]|nr:metalloregulator ArsR/SmtB family transcription factor [Acidisphaera sp.]
MSRRSLPARTDTCDPRQAADLLRALAHPMRLQILCRLLEGELAVSGFEAELGLRQPSLSQQLGQLREAGLVATRREAKSVVYRLADPRVRLIIDALHQALVDKPAPQPATPSEPPPRRGEAAACGVFSQAGWPGGANRGGR